MHKYFGLMPQRYKKEYYRALKEVFAPIVNDRKFYGIFLTTVDRKFLNHFLNTDSWLHFRINLIMHNAMKRIALLSPAYRVASFVRDKLIEYDEQGYLDDFKDKLENDPLYQQQKSK